MGGPGDILGGLAEFERWETFWVDGQRVGAIRRVWRYSVLLTRIAIERDGEPYLAESRIRFVPGPDWDLSWFHATGMDEPALLQNPATWTSTGSMPLVPHNPAHFGPARFGPAQSIPVRSSPAPSNPDPAGSVPTHGVAELPAGTPRTAPAGTLPGYGAFLVLLDLVASGRHESSWTSVADRDATTTSAARMVLAEEAQVPGFIVLPAGTGGVVRYERTSGGRHRASHWVRDGAVLASAWGDAHSLWVRDDAGTAAWDCIAGLQEGPAQFLLHGRR